jgi:hypothetical protein
MNCPVCEEKLGSWICTCGYDISRDYEKYPTFGALILRKRNNRQRRSRITAPFGYPAHICARVVDRCAKLRYTSVIVAHKREV